MRRYRKTYKGRSRRKIFSRKKKQVRRGNRLTWKPSGGLPMPQEYITKVRGRAQGILTPTGAIPIGFNSLSNWYFNSMTLNNLYQPFAPFQSAGITQVNGLNWATNTFLQPVGHLTLCNSTTYQSYQVLATAVKASFYPATSSDRIDACIGPIAYGGASVTNITEAITRPQNKIGSFCPGERVKPLKLYVDHAKLEGIDKKVFRNDVNVLTAPDSGRQWSGNFNSTPAYQTGMYMCAQVCYRNQSQPITFSIGFVLEFTWYVRYYGLDVSAFI